jgi:hypothetical protein
MQIALSKPSWPQNLFRQMIIPARMIETLVFVSIFVNNKDLCRNVNSKPKSVSYCS